MKIVKKIRVDELLARQQDISLEESKKLILAGLVRINSDQVVKKASDQIGEGINLILDESMQYVSRGAFKLKPSLRKYIPDMRNLVAADIGASTGGFTDLMLQSGASKVYAIDVGYGQLHYKLRQDLRVVNIERINARNIPADLIPEKVDVITMDLSFISAIKVLPSANQLLQPGGLAFILIKPQFEARSSEVGKGGVVRDRAVIERCISSVQAFAQDTLDWKHLETTPSPILGPSGNQEYIAVFIK